MSRHACFHVGAVAWRIKGCGVDAFQRSKGEGVLQAVCVGAASTVRVSQDQVGQLRLEPLEHLATYEDQPIMLHKRSAATP
eukprot:278788-Pelagomonas_calceolata.AAC.3